jgi:hypothetical protein
MSGRAAAAPRGQRNALAPGILAALVLVVAPALLASEWFTVIRFVVAILALIVAWFAVKARQWWWVPVLVAIAVLWNPVVPFAFGGAWWVGGQLVAAVVFLVAASNIRTPAPESA